MKTIMMSIAAVVITTAVFAQRGTGGEMTGTEQKSPGYSANTGIIQADSTMSGSAKITAAEKFGQGRTALQKQDRVQKAPAEKKIYPRPAYIFKNGRPVKNKRK